MFNHPDFLLTIAADRRTTIERRLEFLRLRRDAEPPRRKRRRPRWRARPADVPSVAPFPH